MTDRDDFDLLRDYAEHGSGPAFRELVRRYVDLVYSSAFRQVRDPHAAEDVTQAVFIVLTRKAKQFRPGSVLPAWLLGVTRFASKDYLKRARRRRHYEQAAAFERSAEMVPVARNPADPPPPPPDDGEAKGRRELDGALDDALAKLPAAARDALVLRFFEEQSFRQVGDRLGITEVAARQRVFRGLERLRAMLARRGVRLGGDALGVALAATAVLPAPAPLGAAVVATASSASAAANYAALVKGTVTLMKLSSAKPAIVAAVLLLFVVGTITAGLVIRGINSTRSGTSGRVASGNLPAGQVTPGGNAQPAPPADGQSKLLAAIDFMPENYTPPGYPRPNPWPAPQPTRVPVIEQYAGPPITGTVKSPDGRPVAGAEAILLTPTNLRLSAPRRGPAGVDHAPPTNADGRFELKPRFRPTGLFVRAAEGFAWVPVDAIKPEQTVTLSSWSRLDLTVKEGARPLAGAKVAVYPAALGDSQSFSEPLTLTADASGRVTVDHVLPGDTRIAWSAESAPRLPPREMRLAVEPGKTHTISLGGTGRPVTGTLAADVSNLTHRRGVIRPAASPQSHTIHFDAREDGSFTVADVPSGDYELTVDLGTTGGKNIKITESHALARTTFKMPPIPGDFNDHPLDVGKVPATQKLVLDVGEAFPKLAGETPAGEQTSTEVFHGKVLLVQVGGLGAFRSRGEVDWMHALHARFGHHPDFAMLTVTAADQPDGPPSSRDAAAWPSMRLEGRVPEELQASTAPLFLVDADGRLAAKNVTAAQVYAVLDRALDGKPDPRVAFDFVDRADARRDAPFAPIPAPEADDAAAGARVSLVGGIPSWDTPRSDVSVLTDGRMLSGEDAPAESIFFQAGTLEGRFRIDLKELTDVAEIRTYSWHKDTRAAQLFRVYGSDGAAAGFNPVPGIGLDPTKHGWTAIAFVDTRPGMKPVGVQLQAQGGRYASSISDKQEGSLGAHRHLLFQVFVIESDDVFGHTFYGEIDVIRRNR